jgi:hypothetical protein
MQNAYSEPPSQDEFRLIQDLYKIEKTGDRSQYVEMD